MDRGAFPFCDTMNSYYRPILAIVVISAVTLIAGCTKISLGGKNGGTGSTQTGSAGGNSTGGAPQPAAGPPTVQGVWKLSFKFGEQEISSDMELAQQGDQLAGQGQDENGTPWAVAEGTVQGDKVRFSKQYSADRPPIIYEGVLKWLQDPQYTGWMMEGNYQTQTPDGKVVSGEWVATPADPSSMPPPSSAAPPTTQAPIASVIGNPRPDSPPDASPSPPDGKAPHLSGRYDGEYEFKFKKVKMKMWLEQDNNRVTGHGIDVNTNEKFTIEKGWYAYPKITLIRKYFKGAGAANTREFTFKGKVTSSSAGPVLKGETEYGGDWSATIVR